MNSEHYICKCAMHSNRPNICIIQGVSKLVFFIDGSQRNIKWWKHEKNYDVFIVISTGFLKVAQIFGEPNGFGEGMLKCLKQSFLLRAPTTGKFCTFYVDQNFIILLNTQQFAWFPISNSCIFFEIQWRFKSYRAVFLYLL